MGLSYISVRIWGLLNIPNFNFSIPSLGSILKFANIYIYTKLTDKVIKKKVFTYT